MIHFFASYVCVYLAARSLSVFLLASAVCQHAIFTLSWSFMRSTANNFDRNLARYVSVHRLALIFDVLTLCMYNTIYFTFEEG